MANTLSEISVELVGRAAEGDGFAVEAIVRALERPVYAVALRMLLDREDAEDATQESLIRIVTRLAQYRGESLFSTWALRIAVRRVLDYRDRRAATARYTVAEFEADLAEGRDDEAVERQENAVLYRELKVICSRAMLQCLDSDHRIAFVLGEILELSSAEAAEILEIDAATFRKRLSRARSTLSEFLERTCGHVNPQAPCACHRRLDRALAMKRVKPAELEVREGNLAELRVYLSTLSEMHRAAAFYRADLNVESKRDFVTSVRSLLTRLPESREGS